MLLLYLTQIHHWPTISIVVISYFFLFLYRDYTRPDLPSGPNENPFGGADIASLAALGEMRTIYN